MKKAPATSRDNLWDASGEVWTNRAHRMAQSKTDCPPFLSITAILQTPLLTGARWSGSSFWDGWPPARWNGSLVCLRRALLIESGENARNGNSRKVMAVIDVGACRSTCISRWSYKGILLISYES